MRSFTSQALSTLLLSAALVGSALAQAVPRVDTSLDGIYMALTSSKNLQSTVDTLVANGATFASVVSVAGAAGISLDAVKGLHLCTTEVSGQGTPKSATCMKPSSMKLAFADGQNDPMRFLPATAAGPAKTPTQRDTAK